jgi:hypothetical protein
MAYETEIINGNKVVVRHIFKANEIKVGSRWQPADGAKVIYTIEGLNQYGNDWYEVVYSYEKNGQKFTYEKDVFNFQCHHCLIVD